VQEEPADHSDGAPKSVPPVRRKESIPGQLNLIGSIIAAAGPHSRIFKVTKRVWTGVYNDGFIHAGNFAYMSLLSLFPFFITVAAILSVIGEQSQKDAAIDAFLAAIPPSAANVLGPVARDVVTARQGWLLWVGGLVGVWTASSLIETIRDILHRAYRTPSVRAFWEYRLVAIGVIFGSVFLLLVALGAQFMITALQELVFALFPQLDTFLDEFIISRLIGGFVLFGAMYLLFVSLTPRIYQKRIYPKWPGALLIATWWVLLTVLMPIVLRTFFTYDLTYGSLAGVMIALFFFWLVGLGMVVGAELNAALAVSREDSDTQGSAEDDHIQEENP